VRLEGLGTLKKFNDLIGKGTNKLPACSIVPQPTTLPRAHSGDGRWENEERGDQVIICGSVPTCVWWDAVKQEKFVSGSKFENVTS
jgi:hypothetical protein